MASYKADRLRLLDDCIVELRFFDGTVKEYDMKNLFSSYPQFRELQTKPELFLQGKLDVPSAANGIIWNDNLDIAAEEIWQYGKTVRKEKISDEKVILSNAVVEAREKLGITQVELAKRAGIYQPDLSDIERANKNPSLSTIKKIADGLGMDLHIEFTERTMPSVQYFEKLNHIRVAEEANEKYGE